MIWQLIVNLAKTTANEFFYGTGQTGIASSIRVQPSDPTRRKRKKLNKQTNKQFYLKGLIINDTFIGWFIKFYYTDGIDIISEQLREDTNCQLKFIKNFWTGFIKWNKDYRYHIVSWNI